MGTLETQRKCFYCGKPYVKKVLPIKGNGVFCSYIREKYGSEGITIYVADCNCQSRHEEEEKRKKEAEKKQEALNKRFDNSLMTPLFRDKKFINLNKCEHFGFCFNYAAEFNPETSKGIQMIGEAGTGKTTLLAAICNKLIENGFSCLFMTFSELIENILTYSGEHAGNISDRLQWLRSFDFVVLDDIGRESYNTERRNEIAFRIIDTLLNYKVVTCFSANPEMISRLKTVQTQNAALDRLKDMCPHKLIFKGESLRGKGD